VVDAAPSFNAIVGKNKLKTVFCNDHSRRKFVEAGRNAPKASKSKSTQEWVANKAIAFYKRLYKIEKEIRDLPPDQRYQRRLREAVPIWETFMEWAKQVQTLGVRHAKSRKALAYLINHEAGLRRYCDDGRLPISNILTEHVAKTIAIARNYGNSCFMQSAVPQRRTGAVAVSIAFHNYKARRKAISGSDGTYLAAITSGGCTRDSACSFIVTSASMYI
jgi:hypothetical protein